ncbi:MAG: FtsX-like permease family protein [Gammaproteobacteria bacterium]|nr:FtsX-like permease family protein [Gammaproteobacteria bacterium]
MRLTLLGLFKLASQQLLRERHTSELRILFFALMIAVASSSTIGHFAERLQGAMQLSAGEFLAADLVLSSSEVPSPTQIAAVHSDALKSSQTVQFASMLATEDDLELASVKAVDDMYPLRGALRSREQLQSVEISGGRPQSGEVWLDLEMLTRLELQIGDSLEIGSATFNVARILTYEPDRAGNLLSFTPRAMIHIADLPATDVLQPGSRVSYRQLWSGDAPALAILRDTLQDTLLPHQRIEDLSDGNQQVSSALERAASYLNLASLAAILLAGVAVALSANRFARQRFDQAALMRCFGLSRRHTVWIFCMQLLQLALLASLLGSLIGWLTQFVLFELLADLLPDDVPAGSWKPFIAGITTSVVMLAGFALPPLIALGRIAPLRVLRRDLIPAAPATWLLYGMVFIALGVLMWQLNLDMRLTSALLVGGGLAATILGTALFVALKSIRFWLAKRSLAWRLSLGHLLRYPLNSVGQIMAFALILLSMALIVLLRSELLDNWQAQLPDQAPNHFAINILPAQQPAFSAALEQISTNAAPLYPVILGRLTQINNRPATEQIDPKANVMRTLKRDLNLTWTDTLPKDNQVTAGHWWPTNPPSNSNYNVSLESDLAKKLGVTVGEQLTFHIGGSDYVAHISSLRSVDWNSMQPNFFVIFDPQQMSKVAHTYMTSFYLPAQAEQQRIDLSKTFPSVSILQVDAVLRQLRDILAQVTLAIELILLFVLAAGVSVLIAGLHSTLTERIQQGALIRALGASRKLLVQSQRNEFALIGVCSGVLAWLGCEISSYILYRLVFDLAWQPHLWLISLPLLGAALITTVGMLGTRQVLNSSPLQILRGN